MPEGVGRGGRPKWADLPRIDAEQRVATQVVSGEALAWARERAAAPRSEVAAGRLQGDCATCRAEGVLLYRSEPNDPESALVCAPCVRREARPRERQTLCDNDPGHGAAWRNPFTRRNEYFCGRCHAATDEGVVQNRWARVMDSVEPRLSLPLGVREGAVCEAKGVAGTKPCRGEIKPRGGSGALLCNQHAGKTGAADR